MQRTTKIALLSIAGVVVVASLCLVCFAAGLFIGARFRDAFAAGGRTDPKTQAIVGRLLCEPAPDLALPTLGGSEWRLADQRGKVVVLDFWATWCGPCRRALPQVKRLWEERRDRPDFVLAGVALEKDAATVKAFCKDEEMDWPQLKAPDQDWDENAFAKAFSVESIPNLVVLDQKGRVAGWDLSPAQAEALVDGLLAGKAEPKAPPTPRG